MKAVAHLQVISALSCNVRMPATISITFETEAFICTQTSNIIAGDQHKGRLTGCDYRRRSVHRKLNERVHP